jgi:4-alpha-glucanotransferase
MVTFHIHYTTHYGDKLGILGGGQSDTEQLIFMQSTNGSDWHYDMPHITKAVDFHYKYAIITANGDIKKEWGKSRVISLAKSSDLYIMDKWRSRSLITNTFLSSAFTKAIFKRSDHHHQEKMAKNGLMFSLNSTLLSSDYIYGVIGGSASLGEWKKPLPMQHIGDGIWEVFVSTKPSSQTFSYKYVTIEAKTGEIFQWETGENRSAIMPESLQSVKITDDYFRRDKNWKGAGVAVPIFSLRTKDSFGIGELTDLGDLITWTHHVGMNVIQVLPINDTLANMSWEDSYPYAAISVMALHPLYINIPSVGSFDDPKDAKAYLADQYALNALEVVDYERVLDRKFYYFRVLYAQVKTQLNKDKAYQTYINDQASWLPSYAAFCYLRDINHTCRFDTWQSYSVYDEQSILDLCAPDRAAYDDITFYMWLQYHADRQLLSMRDKARDHGIALKGDLPIGIYRYSCDAWIAPALYNMSQQAGAPPDDYAELGQNWGFPTYNWDIMRQDGYAWWRARMQQLNRYFDALRIDHILGFFRIWQIPTAEVQGTLGMFNPRLPYDRDELARYGLHGDLGRYTDPYITDTILSDTFGQHADWVKKTFLEAAIDGRYIMKFDYKYQQSIVQYFKEHPERAELAIDIMNMISNVILLSEQDGHHFNPRITVSTTTSYQSLAMWEQQAVMTLYNEYYYRRHDQYWKEQALERLPAVLDASDMMICGEDLGMIPDAVPGVMHDLNIISLEIQRMPKGNERFGQVGQYPYASVCSPSCHDMSTIRGWWESDHDLAKAFYYDYLGKSGVTPQSCTTDIVRSIIWDHMISPSMLAIFPLQDLVGMDNNLRKADAASEQINVPANVKHYWRYRFHAEIQSLIDNQTFTESLRTMVKQAGR